MILKTKLPLFDNWLEVYYGEPIERFIKRVKVLGQDICPNEGIDGLCITFQKGYAIWTRCKDKPTLIHELTHLMIIQLSCRGFEISNAEPWSYYMEWLYKNVADRLK